MSTDELGIGVDLILVERFRYMLNDTGLPFLRRIFTPLEVAIALEDPDPVQSLAGRFALKEAVIKSLPGTPLTQLDLRKIEITRGQDWSPEISLPEELSYRTSGSLAYEGGYAIGVAIVLPNNL